MKPSDFLKRGWTQGANARKHDGIPISALDHMAESWCMVGAYVRWESEQPHRPGTETFDRFTAAVRRAIGLSRGDQLHVWNDDPSTTRDAVLAAVEAAEAEIGL